MQPWENGQKRLPQDGEKGIIRKNRKSFAGQRIEYGGSVLKIHVAEEDAGQSVERFLRIGLGLSRKQISRPEIREEGIRLNGLRQRVTQTLHTGDLLEVRLETGGEKAGKWKPALASES